MGKRINKKRSRSKKSSFAAGLLAAVSLFSFCGCGEVREINDMAVVSGFSVDEADGRYIVTAEVVNKNEAGSPEENRQIVRADGKTLSDALANCNFLDSRQMYFSHARTIVISRRIAENEGLSSVLDYVMRNYDMRLSTELLISDLETAGAVSELSSPATGLVYYDLEEMAKTDAFYGASLPVKVYQAVNTLEQNEIALTVPMAEQRGEKPFVAGLAVFRGNQMVGTLSQEETLFLLLIQGHLTRAHLTLPDGVTGLDIKRVHRTLSGEAGRSPSVSLKLYCSLAQSGSLSRQQELDRIAERTARFVESECGKLIARGRAWDCDLLGFQRASRFGQKKSVSESGNMPVRVSCTVILNEGEIH